MERFPFLDLYISLSRLLAGILALFGIVQAFRAWEFGFWAFVITLGTFLLWSLLILVGADVLACFKAIEQNTRKTP